MEIDKQTVSEIRGAYGWSKAELSRQLGVDLIELENFETGAVAAPIEVMSKFKELGLKLDKHAEKIKLIPEADQKMNNEGLIQVADEEIQN